MLLSKKAFFLLLFLCYVCLAYPQKVGIGISSGLTFNHVENADQYNLVVLKTRRGTDFSLDVFYKIGRHFSLLSSFGKIQKNYTIQNITNRIFQNITNTYLYVPVGIKYSFNVFKKMNVFSSISMYGGYWTKSTISGFVPNVFSITREDGSAYDIIKLEEVNYAYKFDSKKDERFEFGWSGSMGVEYALYKKVNISLNGSFIQSTTDQQKEYAAFLTPKVNQTLKFSIGCIYLF
jgi:hypothetical protein